MDIFVRNVPDQSTSKQLHKFLLPHMRALGTDVFNCNKFKNKKLALVTVLDPVLAHRFLAMYGDNAGRIPTQITPKLTYLGQTLCFSAGNRQADPVLLQSLRKEAKDKAKKVQKALPAARLERKYPYLSLWCGVWDYTGSKLSFIYHFHDARSGRVMFGKQALALVVEPDNGLRSCYRVDFPYNSIQSITLGDFQDSSLTFTLAEAPRIFEISELDQTLQALVNSLRIGSHTRTVPRRKRISSLGPTHDTVVSSCFVYRILLAEPSSLRHIESLLKQGQKLPPSISCPTPIMKAKMSFHHELRALSLALTYPSEPLSFGVKFQMQRLAQNGYLAPALVLKLLPEVTRICARSGSVICIEAVRKLFRQIPYAGPDADPNGFDLGTLLQLLRGNEESARANGCPMFDLTQQHSHIALIHKATVTPTGVFLEGPEPETKNRVLRKYDLHTDFFLRVSFLDEDGVPLRFDKHVLLDDIYHKRFKGVLSAFIEVAGRKYEFLGFSHSSLREQTCWFMAPFVHNIAPLNARGVIASLGDFTTFRSPAKCAARIGQAFSETNGTVKLNPGAVQEVEDIERNDRVFSDGVGTFSYEILQKVWRDYAFGRAKPTLLQIRWAGAKGMISVDTRLEGERMLVRPSMIKFQSSDKSDIEICGSGSRPLPLRLNRQFIKIMEDLLVEPQGFLDLQNSAVEELRRTTENPLKAADFLERNNIGQHAHLPWLIRKLHAVNFGPLKDTFIKDVVELATLIQLRELKHRSRIPVEEGVTLYGVMDEFDVLKEGEIYCCTDKHVVEGKVTITRAPALHPGDIQFATAVDIPDDSPLNSLHNCIAFSQHGQRDLPSQLSGGDLDGDLYNVIWDPRLQPKITHPPADYPKVPAMDIGRSVERSDMTDFFIKFMENDQLGRIATLHQQFADIKPMGTFDPECINLAEMHSTAVDFSKTGAPVNLSKLPRSTPLRPDFMAPGPRYRIEKQGIQFIEEMEDEEEEDVVTALDPEGTEMRYYESPRILGRLYRAIDEHDFLKELQKLSKTSPIAADAKQTLIDQTWQYAFRQTRLVQWSHQKDNARDIREAYETCLVDTMYQYGPSSQPLSEVEVFTGSVLGKNGGLPSRRQREASTEMKDKVERDITFTVKSILQGSGESHDQGQDEALARSIACLAVAAEEPGNVLPKIGKLQSFAYVAAAVCLRQIDGFHGAG